ncbi:carbohydrate esterase family 16 protein [Mycena belliarum]|uniref:Carbohydrate esterase family 16 protein n=1 Tax=Mycena belliarum TaxID=1033014 RepID=A0AAD6TY08_9AGAR|nr:carbohydrate esterase family 16 protein [Mycena belliae]
MFPLVASILLTFLCTTASAVTLPRASAVHLAISPQCGTLSGGSPSDVNVGLKLSGYKTIVAFGDSFTGGGTTNGPTWVQNLASSVGAKLINYAASGAVVDINQWPQAASVQAKASVDFINQANNFTTTQDLDPSTTLYVIFFGIGKLCSPVEFAAAGKTDMNQIAGVLVYTLLELSSSPSFAKNILIVDNYGLGKTSPAGDAFKQDLFTSLGTGRSLYGWNVGFVSFNNFWNGVLYGTPGAAAFGYTSTGVCVQGNATCSDPSRTFYWAPGNPSAATHSLMASYVEQVLSQCQSST